MYDLALKILLQWNENYEILDITGMSLHSALVVQYLPFFINLHTYSQEFPVCLQETLRSRMPGYQRLIFNLIQA